MSLSDDLIREIAGNEKEWREHLLKTADEIKTQVQKQNGRIRNLENWRSWMLGAIGVLSFVVITMITIVVNILW